MKALNPSQTIPSTPQQLSSFLDRLYLKDKQCYHRASTREFQPLTQTEAGIATTEYGWKDGRTAIPIVELQSFATLDEYYCSARFSFDEATNIIVKSQQVVSRSRI